MNIRNFALTAIMMLLMCVSALAQQANKISGIIVDVDGLPMTGASVTVVSKNIGTIADVDGSYTLEGVEKGDIILFDFIGFLPTELVFDGIQTHNVVMRLASQTLDDVVVVGYGSQKKVSVTGAL